MFHVEHTLSAARQLPIYVPHGTVIKEGLSAFWREGMFHVEHFRFMFSIIEWDSEFDVNCDIRILLPLYDAVVPYYWRFTPLLWLETAIILTLACIRGLTLWYLSWV